MPPNHAARAPGRVVASGAAALTAVLTLAHPASAHAEVEAGTARALAENVRLTFVSEAESDSAGFTRIRVVLPDGIAPGDIRLTEAPKGWKLKTAADGYTVAGPALKTGVDALHRIKVRQLPDAEQLVFKTVETYSDGEIARWIELPNCSVEPEQPAPVLELNVAGAEAAPGSPDPSSSDTVDTTPAATPAGARPAAKAAATQDDGASTGPLVGSVVVALLVLSGGAWWLSRRRASSDVG
ncbi:DUF1775 domain-containing protein [Streptomyces sp. NPDC048558]|uniref:DUF1775 domain-containing protein n=1 Tax=Streptomyces sp. NPDC048558 TaxID=3155759 RepID=UPI0033F68DD3